MQNDYDYTPDLCPFCGRSEPLASNLEISIMKNLIKNLLERMEEIQRE